MKTTMYVPDGHEIFDDYQDAIKYVRLNYPQAVRVRRWCSSSHNYEDFHDNAGNVLLQLVTTGYPMIQAGFDYV